jgi:hypothetical protein
LNFNTTAGLVYQVQYTTNLMSGSWVNLGSAITAGTNTLTVTDTGATSPQRYYRLEVSP